MSIEAMKQWREALENTLGFTGSRQIDSVTRQAITSISQAIAEAERQQLTNVVNPSIHAGSGEKTGENHDFHHSGIEQKPLASDGSDGSGYKKAIDDVKKAYGITSDMKQEHGDKTAKQRHEENT